MINNDSIDALEQAAPLSAAASPQHMAVPDGWKPIASAPRDGSNIIIRFGEDGVSQAKYIAGLPFPWQFIDTNDGVTWLINHAKDAPGGPSHWIPLPSKAAPTCAADGARPTLTVPMTQFLTDVTTAAGLLAGGRADKGLAKRIGAFAFDLRRTHLPAPATPGLSAEAILDLGREVGILGPISDGNVVKFARAVLSATKGSTE